MVKIYTRTGDRGQTSLLSGGRVAKNDARIEAYGTLDELSSVIGLLRCEAIGEEPGARLVAVQSSLLAIGAVLADREGRHGHDPTAWSVEPLERWIDSMEEGLPRLRSFVLPGGCRAAALCHLARTVCRRAERRVQTVAAGDNPPPEGILSFVNRLSDCLFVLARELNRQAGVADVTWPSGSEPGEDGTS